jgi:hypothetical protein
VTNGVSSTDSSERGRLTTRSHSAATIADESSTKLDGSPRVRLDAFEKVLTIRVTQSRSLRSSFAKSSGESAASCAAGPEAIPSRDSAAVREAYSHGRQMMLLADGHRDIIGT